MTLSLGSFGSQQQWTETEHWQTQHFRQLQAEEHRRRNMKLITDRTMPSRPNDMILPRGSLGKIVLSEDLEHNPSPPSGTPPLAG